MRGGCALALLLVAGFCMVSRPAAAQRAADFDFYVLALSWSPTFCALTGNDRGDAQCSSSRPRAFVLHGLWPQYERGYPRSCGGTSPPRVPDGTIARMLDIMPSRGLVIHEWRTHGTCSGLDPQSYFDTARRAFSQITIPEALRTAKAAGSASPDDIEQAFLKVNPAPSREGIAVTCARGRLEEVRICLSRTLQPRRCAEVDRQACRAGVIDIPGAAAR